MNSNQVLEFRRLLLDALHQANKVGDEDMCAKLTDAHAALWSLETMLERNEVAAGPFPIADETDDEAGN